MPRKGNPHQHKRGRKPKERPLNLEVEFISEAAEERWRQIFALLEKGEVKDEEDKDDPDGQSLIQQSLF